MTRNLFLAVLSFALLGPISGFAQSNKFTGNSLVDGCRSIEGSSPPVNFNALAADAGLCTGIVAAIYALGKFFDPVGQVSLRSCPPPGSTVGQAIKIVLRDLDQKPELLNEDFRVVTAISLHRAWPCN